MEVRKKGNRKDKYVIQSVTYLVQYVGLCRSIFVPYLLSRDFYLDHNSKAHVPIPKIKVTCSLMVSDPFIYAHNCVRTINSFALKIVKKIGTAVDHLKMIRRLQVGCICHLTVIALFSVQYYKRFCPDFDNKQGDCNKMDNFSAFKLQTK